VAFMGYLVSDRRIVKLINVVPVSSTNAMAAGAW